jgi:hypothetical protein
MSVFTYHSDAVIGEAGPTNSLPKTGAFAVNGFAFQARSARYYIHTEVENEPQITRRLSSSESELSPGPDTAQFASGLHTGVKKGPPHSIDMCVGKTFQWTGQR